MQKWYKVELKNYPQWDRAISYWSTVDEAYSSLMPCVQMVGMFECNDRYSFERRDMHSIMVLVTMAGEGVLDYNGQLYEIKQGKGFIIDCMTPHRYWCKKGSVWHKLWLHFYGANSQALYDDIVAGNGILFDASDGQVTNCIFEILNLFSSGTSELYHAAYKYIYQILSHIKLLPANKNKNKGVPDILAQALQIIESDYGMRLTVQELADTLYINKYVFIRKFKEFLNCSPYQYITKHRLAQARFLLAYTQLTVEQISEKCGYQDAGNFIHLFRKYTGVTPLAFRKLYAKSRQTT